ncbi:hypothetical protein C7M84_007645 [Penaeus vannamei]|uniref:Uncharacterized protein n=1 Tax=Penaeus vannamei TaxID=6689 RepID=A0A3R7QBQ4_PENVA|nr:hypothetical protein C7M84_007645 [Penaeus vannamei]
MTDLRSVHSSRERRQIRNLAEAFVKVSVLGASQEAFEGAACWQRWVLVWQSASGCGSGKGPRHSLPECCAKSFALKALRCLVENDCLIIARRNRQGERQRTDVSRSQRKAKGGERRAGKIVSCLHRRQRKLRQSIVCRPSIFSLSPFLHVLPRSLIPPP